MVEPTRQPSETGVRLPTADVTSPPRRDLREIDTVVSASSPGNWTATVQLPADPVACPLGRYAVRWLLRWWRLEQVLEAAELVAAEMIGNAVAACLSAGVPPGWLVGVELRVAAVADRLVIEVSDPDPRPPVRREAGLEDENGRGLLLVEALADRWGYLVITDGGRPVGKVVGCVLAVAAPVTAAGLPRRAHIPPTAPGRRRPALAVPDLALLRRVHERLQLI